LRRFDLELPGVGDVLVAAATALAEIRTRRLDSIRRRRLHFHQLCLAKILFLPQHARGDLLARNRERNEIDFPIMAGDAFAAKGDVMNFE